MNANRGELGTLGNQPLGKILFNDNRFVRSEFELFHCDARHPLCRSLNIEPSKGLWGRRSVFRFQTHRLMVCEVFLPDSPAYGDWETG